MTAPRSRRGFVAVLSALAVGWTGTRLLNIALPWFVLTSTGSATATGLVVFAQMGPFVVAQLLSGPFIDRVGPKRISVFGDLLAAGFLAAVPVAYLLDALSLPVLMILIALVGMCEGPASIAKSVFLPDVAEKAQMRLERATGLTGAIERTASTVGPALAGLVVGAFGGVLALFGTAALTAVAGVIVALATTNPRPEPAADDDDAGYLARMRGGASFLRKEKLLLSIFGMIAVTNLLDNAFSTVLLPLWAKTAGYGAEMVGLLFSLFAATSVVASLAAAAWGHRLPRRTVYLVGMVVGSVPKFLLIALDAPLWLIIVSFLVGGLGSGFINPIIGAIQYERVPKPMLGRATTLGRSMTWAGIPFGGLVAGAMVAIAGLSGGLLVLGVIYAAVVVLPGLRPEWAQTRTEVPGQRTDEADAAEPERIDAAGPEPSVPDPAGTEPGPTERDPAEQESFEPELTEPDPFRSTTRR